MRAFFYTHRSVPVAGGQTLTALNPNYSRGSPLKASWDRKHRRPAVITNIQNAVTAPVSPSARPTEVVPPPALLTDGPLSPQCRLSRVFLPIRLNADDVNTDSPWMDCKDYCSAVALSHRRRNRGGRGARAP